MRKTENIINRTGINKTECKKNGHSKENKIPGVWNGSLFFLIIILGITLGIFAGCKNIFVPEPPVTPEAAGPGGGITVSLRLFTGSARSVMPGMEDLNWEITATSDDAKATVLGKYPDFKIYFPFKGKWTIKVKGKSGTESDPKEIFTGEKTMEITGSTVSISIPLSPGDGMGGDEAKGNLKLTIKRQNVNLMSLNYRIDGSKDWGSPVNFGEGDYTITYESLPVGRHTLDLYFSSNSDKGEFYFCTVAVNIWPGMTSDQWIKTNGEEYITDGGEFVITEEMVNEFVKTMGSVVFVNESVGENTPGTGSIYAPVNSVSKAVDILRKVNPEGKCNGTIMVSGEATIKDEIKVENGEKLTVKGMGADASITNTSGRVFNIASDGSLTLGENITLTGTVTDGNGGAVYVNGGTFTMEAGSAITGGQAAYGGGVYVAGGNFIMEAGSKITGSRATGTTDSSGGAVYVAGGSFTMNGTATIQGNTAATHGGGVHILTGGTFTMNGGTIDGTIGGTAANTAENGGGVFVSGGTFNMNGGTISGNTVTQSGGGVCIYGGTFTMSDSAVISGNTATRSGGGVFVSGSGDFIMEGGTIGGIGGENPNSAENGGGVYIHNGTFTMSDRAVINGNNASSISSSGGGVYIFKGAFTMSDRAVISGNNATSSGGGVYVYETGEFTMEGGTIGGTDVATTGNSSGSGGGVCVYKGDFTMSGGAVISGNTATSSGGGVFVQGGTFTMEGGTIGGAIPNTADQNGGGVYVDGGTFTVSGSSPVITENAESNVYLANGNTITIGVEDLTGGTIGVTAAEMGQGKFVSITDKTVDRADTIFTSDVEGYTIVESSDTVYLSDVETMYVTTGGKYMGTFVAALAAVNGSSGTITLLKNIDSSNAVFGADSANNQPITFTGGTEEDPIILDLNGYTIDRRLSTVTAVSDGSVIKIVGGTLTIKDSSATNSDGTGKITGGNSSNAGGGIHITSNSIGPVFGSLILQSGSISGNTADSSNGGGIYIEQKCSLTMNGGSIDGNTVKNSATSHGGGVFVYGTFTMENGIITKNSSEQGNGGGVNIGSNGSFTMTGGTISGNTATQKGGGVYVSRTGSFTLGSSSATASSPVVSGNTKTSNSTNNVYLDGTILLIGGELKKSVDSGNIGISMATQGEEFTYGWGSSGSTDPTFFFSDDTQYKVEVNDKDELCLVNPNLIFVKGGSCTLNRINVTLSSFWISKYEVTQEEFVSIMTGNQNNIEPNPSYFPDNPAAGEVQRRRPVEQVRWYEAIVYCNLLSMKEGLTPCYTIKGFTNPAAWGTSPTSTSAEDYNDWESVTCNFEADGYRLPTEAEWEYAARGGQTGIIDNSWDYDYSGSDTINDVAWYGGDSGNSDSKTHEVGKKDANALGLYDMSGNVYEWCWDWIDDNIYPTGNTDPIGNDSGTQRVLRGGSWMYISNYSKVSYRFSQPPTTDFNNCGFRVVRSAR